ncbi:MAG TPA: acyl carrier protein [Verrucomicrobiales bacterium]|jgi:acyl carrier protein|nr:acyl carrier protein [Verrucomicrobiales bacterium]
MTRAEFLLHLDKIVEAVPGTLKGDEQLLDILEWDSVGVLSFMAMVDEKFRIQLSAKDIAGCKTVNDLVALPGDRITP